MNRRKNGSVFKFSRTVAKAMFENTMQDRRLEKSNSVIDKTKHRARCDINSQIYALRAEMLRIRACTPNIAEAIMENAGVPLEERGKDPALRKKLKPKGKEDLPHFRMSSATNKHALERINAITSDAPLEDKQCDTPRHTPTTDVAEEEEEEQEQTEDAAPCQQTEDSSHQSQVVTQAENARVVLTKTVGSEISRPSSPKKTVSIRVRGESAGVNRPHTPRKAVIIQSQSMYEFRKCGKREEHEQRPGSSRAISPAERPLSRGSVKSVLTTRSNTPSSARRMKISSGSRLELNPNKHAHFSAARIHRETRLNTNLTMAETLCTLQPRLMPSSNAGRDAGVQQTGALLAKIVKANNPETVYDAIPDVERRRREVLEITKRLEDLYSTPPPWAIISRSSSRQNSIHAAATPAARPNSPLRKPRGTSKAHLRPAETAYTHVTCVTARF